MLLVKLDILRSGIYCCLTSVRGKAFRFKPKISRQLKLKTPTMLALDHYDFYYAPVFGKQWPSIRLGLLSPHKFVAVLNNFSEEVEMNEKILEELHTVNLIQRLTRGKLAVDRISEKEISTAVAAQIPVSEEEVAQFNDMTRTEGGLDQFLPPKSEVSYGQLKNTDGNRKQEIPITGLEYVGQTLPSMKHSIYYPRELKLFVFDRDSISCFPAPCKDRNGISSWWLLDGGSVLPVLALDVQNGEKVLDMCASPGGKSLMIIQAGKFGQLVCNDAKLHRLGQLRRALAMYIPVNSELNERILLKRKDGAALETWDEESIYDKVLVDAPCSTDRLSVHQDDGNLFSISLTQERLNLPQLQTRLLMNAIRSVKVGGSVVYSTCTLSPSQNECVVENAAALVREHFNINVVEQSLSNMENHLRNSTLYRFSGNSTRGSLVVPNIRSNFGPMFVCKLLRQA